jgi:hypothetical protein
MKSFDFVGKIPELQYPTVYVLFKMPTHVGQKNEDYPPQLRMVLSPNIKKY